MPWHINANFKMKQWELYGGSVNLFTCAVYGNSDMRPSFLEQITKVKIQACLWKFYTEITFFQIKTYWKKYYGLMVHLPSSKINLCAC